MNLVKSMGLPVSLNNFDVDYLSKTINYDKKSEEDKINLILLEKISVPMIL